MVLRFNIRMMELVELRRIVGEFESNLETENFVSNLDDSFKSLTLLSVQRKRLLLLISS